MSTLRLKLVCLAFGLGGKGGVGLQSVPGAGGSFHQGLNFVSSSVMCVSVVRTHVRACRHVLYCLWGKLRNSELH